MLSFLLKQYLKTKDFYILHTITGFHALISIKKYLDDYESVLDNYFAHALLLSLFNTKENTYEFLAVEIEEARKKVEFLQDAHDIKLTHSLIELYKEFNIEDIKLLLASIFEK